MGNEFIFAHLSLTDWERVRRKVESKLDATNRARNNDVLLAAIFGNQAYLYEHGDYLSAMPPLFKALFMADFDLFDECLVWEQAMSAVRTATKEDWRQCYERIKEQLESDIQSVGRPNRIARIIAYYFYPSNEIQVVRSGPNKIDLQAFFSTCLPMHWLCTGSDWYFEAWLEES